MTLTVRQQISRIRNAAARDRLPRRFRMLWKSIEGPEPVEELVFHPTRKWRFDLAWPAAKVAVELQGGIWMRRGAHNTGPAIERDCEKSMAAAVLGWRVIPMTERMIRQDTLRDLMRLIEDHANAKLTDHR